MPQPELEWTGEYVDMEVADYWCPSEERWAMCSGPCPDGTPHLPIRDRIVRARVMRVVEP